MKRWPMMLIAVLSVMGVPSHAQPPLTPVFVAEVKALPFVDEVEALGTLQANENVALTSTVTELITVINFEDGQRVNKGDVLVEMDAAEERAELAEERSRVNEAQQQVNRLKPLIARGAASKSTLDERERELQTAKARMLAIESRIQKRQILAPFDGVVGLRNVSVGALAQPGTLITNIDDDRIMKLDFSVPEVFLSVLEPGIKIQATARAFPNEIFEGTLSSVDSRVDPVTRSIRARALLDNRQKRLRPGLLMRVVLKKNPRQALVIPEESVITNGDQNSVYVVKAEGEQSLAERQIVELGARRKGEVEVVNGLSAGQMVITHGTLRVRPGMPVTVKAVESNDETLVELLMQPSSAANAQTPQSKTP